MAGSSAKGATVRFTENFAKNLEELATFLDEVGAADSYDELLERLFEDVVPNLEQFPSCGVDFLARRVQSAEGRAVHRRLTSMAGRRYQIREYVMGEYVVLYALDAGRNAVFLLSIRHHRQLSFDFGGHWD